MELDGCGVLGGRACPSAFRAFDSILCATRVDGGDRKRSQAFTTLSCLTNSGSKSMPIPGPVGTGMAPFLMMNCGEYHDSGFCGLRQTYSMYGPVPFVLDANCRMLTDAEPVCVLCGTIHRLAFR